MSQVITSNKSNETKELLSKAVNNTSVFSRKGILDRLFTKWFDRLVYPQIWEDPEVDIEALELNSDSRIFTISSGGCNVMNYLTEAPQSINVVDLNEAHIALIKLKKVAIEQLAYEDFFDFFGKANLKRNIDIYTNQLEPHLDEKTRLYWSKRPSLFSSARIHYFSDGFYKHGLLGHFIGLIHWVCRRLGYDISQVMKAKSLEEQRELFEAHVAPVFDTRLIKFLSNRAVVMYSLGIPPAQFDEMHKESKYMKMGMNDLLKARAHRLACDYPLETNYFAWQAYNRAYDIENRKAVPRYLEEAYYETVKQHIHKVEINHTSLTERLKEMPDDSLTSYLFLDAQDWMDEEQITEL